MTSRERIDVLNLSNFFIVANFTAVAVPETDACSRFRHRDFQQACCFSTGNRTLAEPCVFYGVDQYVKFY